MSNNSVKTKPYTRARKPPHWQLLFASCYQKLCKQYEAHNKQFADHGRAYPHRIKRGEMKTGVNLLRLWCKQTARKLLDGQMVITNTVKVNRLTLMTDADGSSASRSSVPAHLGKLAYARIIQGEKETDAQPFAERVYRAQDRMVDNVPGKGFGWRPVKLFHGSNRDFEILIDPAVLPIHQIEYCGATFFALDSFGSADTALVSPAPILSFANSHNPPLEVPSEQSEGASLHEAPLFSNSSKRQSLTHNKALTETIEKKKLLSGSASRVESEDGNTKKEDGNGKKAVQTGATAQPERKPGWREEIRQRREKRKEVAGGAARESFAQMILDGRQLEALAKLLIKSYQEKLVKAMKREPYHQVAIDQGYKSALSLLRSVPADRLDAFADRLLLTIDHMARWLTLHPDNFVMPPGRWFDPHYPNGILGAEKRFLRPYEAQAEKYKDAAAVREREDLKRKGVDVTLSKKSNVHFLAFRMKEAMMAIHPKDHRLRSGDLDKWAMHLRRMMKLDKWSWNEILKVTEWLLKSPSKEAAFWRTEAGYGFGIRSASGLRTHFSTLHDLYMREQPRKPTAPKEPTEKRWM